MSISTLPRRWSAMLTLAGLSLILTLVTGVEAEECGRNSRCGYGTRCDTNTTQCVCLSDNCELKKREGNPVSVFYCLKTCKSTNDSCPVNATCIKFDGKYRCACSAAATLSSTGQCLGQSTTAVMSPTAQFTTRKASPPQGDSTKRPKPTSAPKKAKGDDSETLIIGVAAGVGGVLFLAVVVVVVVVLARRRKTKRANNNGPAELRRRSAPPQHPSTPSHHTYHSIVDPPMLVLSGTDNPAGPTVIVRTEVSVISPSSRPGGYEDVDIDFPVVSSIAKVSGESDESKANEAPQANAIIPSSLPDETVEPKDVNALYSNHTIPFNKAQQRHKNNQESSENAQNQYNTLYELRPANGNTAGAMEGNKPIRSYRSQR